MLRDFNVEWLERVKYISAQEFQTYVTGAGVSTGDPVFQEIGTTGITGLQVAAASDAMATFWHFEGEVDTSKQIRFRVFWAKNSTDADAETATVTYLAVVDPSNAAASRTTLIEPATALSTAIAEYTFGTVANKVEATAFGVINRNTLASTTVGLGLKVATTMTNASTTEISLLGLEIRYTPRRTAGPRRNILGGRRLKTEYPSGVQLHASQEGL